MLDCWQKERGHRPKFALLVLTLDKLIHAPELLRQMAQIRPATSHHPLSQHSSLSSAHCHDPSMPDMTRFDSVDDWLTYIKMDRYIDSFHQMGYDSMDAVAKITIKDLINMGITLVGHQKKLMNSVHTLRSQMTGNVVAYDMVSDCAYSVGHVPITDMFV